MAAASGAPGTEIETKDTMATIGRTDAPGPDGGPGNPQGNKVCSQRAKETFFHLHRWLTRTKRKI
jgi:hypothetical protein